MITNWPVALSWLHTSGQKAVDCTSILFPSHFDGPLVPLPAGRPTSLMSSCTVYEPVFWMAQYSYCHSRLPSPLVSPGWRLYNCIASQPNEVLILLQQGKSEISTGFDFLCHWQMRFLKPSFAAINNFFALLLLHEMLKSPPWTLISPYSNPRKLSYM